MSSFRLFLFLLLLFSISGCAGPQIRCTSPEDNPEHHYLRGMEALEANKTEVAQEKFERAVYCNEKFSRGFSGLAIVNAIKTRNQADDAARQGEAKLAGERLKKAYKYADTPEEEFDYNLARMRVGTMVKEKGWLTDVENAYADAMDLKVDEQKLTYYQGKEAAGYYMGIRFLEAFEFQKARDRFADVLNAKRDGKWHEKADRAWKRTERIVRAMAGVTVGEVGRKIAIKDTVSRGDLAALLVDELKIERLFAGRVPVAYRELDRHADFTPADIMNHQFRDEVLASMKWKVRGLEPKYDETTNAYLFRPLDSVTRGEMALIMEDVLIKITGDEKLATAFYENGKSPFPDVRATSPFYNAVMNMTSRGIMEAGDISGEFRLTDPIEGAEALLAVRVLKQRMNIY